MDGEFASAAAFPAAAVAAAAAAACCCLLLHAATPKKRRRRQRPRVGEPSLNGSRPSFWIFNGHRFYQVYIHLIHTRIILHCPCSFLYLLFVDSWACILLEQVQRASNLLICISLNCIGISGISPALKVCMHLGVVLPPGYPRRPCPRYF